MVGPEISATPLASCCAIRSGALPIHDSPKAYALAAFLGYLRSTPTRLKITPQQLHRRRAGQADAKEPVHRALLNLRPSLPTRDRRLADAQQVGELLLGHPQLLPALANLLRRQQPRLAAEGGADLLVGLVVEANGLAGGRPN
jgi:hypothetical protein